MKKCHVYHHHHSFVKKVKGIAFKLPEAKQCAAGAELSFGGVAVAQGEL